MKTRLPRHEFQEALAAVAAVATTRTPKPILSCVHIALKDGSAILSATDGEASLRVTIPALTIDKPGQFVVPADRLLSIIRELPDAEVALQADERHCTVRGAGSELRIYVQNVADFPAIASFDGKPDLVVDGHTIRRMIGLTIYAAAREMSRYAINGVLWEKQGRKLFLVATDGRRLARAGGSVSESNSADFKAIVPSKALSVFERVFVAPKSDENWTIDVKIMPNQVILRNGARELTTILVDGEFPAYQDVIPKEGDKRARMSREELYAGVRRAALLTTDDSRAVRMSFEGNTLTITSSSPEQGEARIELPARYEGAPITIAFNPYFLTDALKVLPLDSVCLEMVEPARPGLIYGEDKNEFLYVLMPVQV